jgi:hypothetical protein
VRRWWCWNEDVSILLKFSRQDLVGCPHFMSEARHEGLMACAQLRAFNRCQMTQARLSSIPFWPRGVVCFGSGSQHRPCANTGRSLQHPRRPRMHSILWRDVEQLTDGALSIENGAFTYTVYQKLTEAIPR